MNTVEDYVKRWAERENKELDTSSEWVKIIRGILKSLGKKLQIFIQTTSMCSFNLMVILTVMLILTRKS